MMLYRTIVSAVVFCALSSCAMHDGVTETQPETMPPASSTYETISFQNQTATADERAKCEAAGGVVQPAGMLGWDNCIQTMPDAGKSCTSASDCLDRCMLSLEGEYADFGEAATGQCSKNDSPFGCYQKVENGIAEPALCVD